MVIRLVKVTELIKITVAHEKVEVIWSDKTVTTDLTKAAPQFAWRPF